MRPDQPVRLSNVTCCYCRSPFSDIPSNEEHVIARKFVPSGTLDRSWNMIAQACVPCNTQKSDLEDDMAVLSLQHYRFDGTDPERDAMAKKALTKAPRVYSRYARKPVSESHQESSWSRSRRRKASEKRLMDRRDSVATNPSTACRAVM